MNVRELAKKLGIPHEETQPIDAVLGERFSSELVQPISGKVHASLGRQYDRLKKLPEAARHYQQALNWYPNSFRLWMRLGSVYHRSQDLERSKFCYDRAMALKPQEVSAAYHRAMVLNDRGEWVAAIAQYQRAIELAGVAHRVDRANAYNNLGCVWVAHNQFDRAMAAYQAAWALNPTSAALHNNLGELWRAQGDLDRAEAAYRQALTRASDDGAIYSNLGKVLQGKNRHQEAVSCFETAIELGEDRGLLSSECGFSLLELGRRSEAMAYFYQSIEPQRAWIEGYCHRVNQRTPRDSWDLAQSACARFLELLLEKPDDCQIDAALTQTYIECGNLQLESGRFDRAADFYQQALSIEPQHWQVLSKLGLCVSQNHNAKRAARVYQNALSHGKMPLEVAIDPPDGVYASTRDWAVATGNFQGYIPVCFNDTQPQPLPTSAVALPPSSDAAPQCEGMGIQCEGINCHKCLRNLSDAFELTHLGQGIQVYANPNPLEIPAWETFVAIVPEGRAWVMPEKSGWQVCEAIAIISPENQFLADVSREYSGQLPNCEAPHPLQHRIFQRNELPPLEKIEGTVAVLAGLSGNVYYHWMVDILPRLEILRRSSIEWDEIDWFLVNSAELPFQRETLRKLGVAEDKIIESDRHPHIQADRAIVPSFPGYLGWMSDWALTFLRETFLPQRSGSLENCPDRIYISRSQARYRHLLNESEIIKLLEASGFTTVDLEKLSIEEQVILFYQAKVIVAPHGSGLTNLIFCQPGTQVVEITSPHYIRHYFRSISQHLDIQHYLVTGEVFPCSPFRQLMYPSTLTEDIWVRPDAIQKAIDRIDLGCNFEQLSPALALPFQLQNGRLDDPFAVNPSTILPIMPVTVNGKLTASDYQQQAEALLANDRFEEAIAACKNALERDPNLAPVCKLLGNALRATHQLEEAKYWYTKAIKIKPNYAEAYANLGNIAIQQQQWKVAIEAFQKAIGHQPDFAAAHERLAQAWQQFGRTQSASECLYRAYELQPNLGKPEEHLNLGNTLLEYGQITQAIASYRRALDLDPQLFGAYQNLAEALTRQGNFEEANKYYRKAVQLGLTNTNLASQTPQPGLFGNDFPVWETPLAEDIPEPAPAPPVVAHIQPAPIPIVSQLDMAPPVYNRPKTGLGQWLSRIVSVFNSPVEPQYGVTPQPANNRPLAEEYIDFGNALLEHRQINRALRCYRRAMEASVDSVDATYENMEKALEKAWQPPEPSLPPESPPTRSQSAMVEDYVGLGNVLLRSHQVGYAMHCYRRAMQLNPEVSEIVYRSLESAIQETLTWDVRKKAVYLPPSREFGGEPRSSGEDEALGLTPLTHAVGFPRPVVDIEIPSPSRPPEAASSIPETPIYPELVYQNFHESPTSAREAIPPITMESKSDLPPRVEAKVEGGKLKEEGDSPPISSQTSHNDNGTLKVVSQASPVVNGNNGKHSVSSVSSEAAVVAFEKNGKHPISSGVSQVSPVVNGNNGKNSVSTFSFESAAPSSEWISVYEQEEIPEHEEAKMSRWGADEPLPTVPKRAINPVVALVEQAEAELQQENFDRCISLCQEAIHVQPKTPIAYKIWADALQGKGNLAEADRQYQQAITLQPNFVKAYLTLGDRYFQAQQWQEAGGVYARIVRMAPQTSEARDRLGDICVTQGYLDHAIRHYQIALKLDAKAWEIHHKLGDIFQAMGKLEEATQAYRQATELAAQQLESSGQQEG